ncbi:MULTISPECIES: hypothetical protein [unclassified Acinetobacter]|uniref:hypothetical protein n=1 Tax=unclassified Acinetobacter TaxID=196816 RepID=UPI0035B97730
MGAAPPEVAAQLDASMDNKYPVLNFDVRFKQIKKSDFTEDMIGQMKTDSFVGACEGFYKNAGKRDEYSRKMLAKIVKEDQVKIHYLVKDSIGQVIFEDTNSISNCFDFEKFEFGNIPYRIKIN